MMKIGKKQVKIVSLAVAMFFVLGIVGLALSQSGTGYAAAAGSNSSVGVVNYQMLVQQHPEMAKADEAMKVEVEQAKKDFEAKSASMSDKEKQDYYQQLQQRLQAKHQSLVAPIYDKIDGAIKGVSEAKGLTVVVDKSNVIYGGQDITEEVLKKISGK